MYPFTLGLVIGTKELWQEVQSCLSGLPVHSLLEQTEVGDWTKFIDKLDRLRPDVLLIDCTSLTEPVDEVIGRIKGTSAAPLVVALHRSADPETILTVIRAGADEYQ